MCEKKECDNKTCAKIDALKIIGKIDINIKKENCTYHVHKYVLEVFLDIETYPAQQNQT